VGDRRGEKSYWFPCIKPAKLYSQFIRKYTNPEGIVLDLMAGSGTTAVANVLAGDKRKSISVELNPAASHLARMRFEEATEEDTNQG